MKGFLWYFAYGSNMNIDRMRKRGVSILQRKLVFLPGWSLKFNKIANEKLGTGYANIVPDKSDWVEGIAYLIPTLDLYKLDFYEGVPTHYRRADLIVYDKKNNPIKTITYLAQPEMVKDDLIPTQSYLNHLLTMLPYFSDAYQKRLSNQQTYKSPAHSYKKTYSKLYNYFTYDYDHCEHC